MNWIESICCVRENQGLLIGLASIDGQYGAQGGIIKSGNSYDYSIQFARINKKGEEEDYEWGIPPDETTPPVLPPDPFDKTTQCAPCAFSLYAQGPGLVPTEGIHVMCVPAMTTVLFQNNLGVLVPVTGGAIVVLTGDLRTWATTIYVTHYPCDMDELTEYFFHLEYYPENQQMDRSLMTSEDGKIAGISNDRRLHIYYGTIKERVALVGIASLIEFQYTTPRGYVQLDLWPSWVDEQLNEGTYHPTLAGWDEVEVGSETLPYNSGKTFLGLDNELSYTVIHIPTNSRDVTRDATGEYGQVPMVTEKAMIEVWRKERFLSPTTLSHLWCRFEPGDWAAWAPGAMVGAWVREGVNIQFTPFIGESFSEAYNSMVNDPAWAVASGTWDTITNPGSLTPTAKPGAIVRDLGLNVDFRYTSYFNYQHTGVAPLLAEFRMGTNAVGSVLINSAFWVELSNGGIRLRERQGGVSVTIGNWVGDITGEHSLEVIRVGAIIKVYIDGTFLIMGRSLFTACVNANGAIYCAANATLLVRGMCVEEAFKDNYVALSNTAGVSTVQGSIAQVLTPIATFNNPDPMFTSYALEWWEDWRTIDNQLLSMTLDPDMMNTLEARFEYDLASGMVDITLIEPVLTATVRVSKPNPIGHYHKWNYSFLAYVTGGNITAIQVVNNDTGEGVLDLTLSAPLAFLQESLVIRIDSIADGGETPYLTQFEHHYWNEGEDQPQLRFPIFLGQLVRYPRVEKDELILEAFDNRYPLLGRSEYWNGDHLGEFSETDALNGMLEEDGDPFWLWFHRWNLNPSSINANYMGFRRRGMSMADLLTFFAQLRGFHYYASPEGQFIIDAYARDWVSDAWQNNRLRLPNNLFANATDPWGVFNSFSSPILANQSLLTYLLDFQSLYDETVDKQVWKATNYGTSFVQDRSPAVGAMIDWEGVASSPQSSTGFIPQTAGGECVRTWANIGADGNDPTNLLTELSQTHVERYGHKNRYVEVSTGRSTGFFRPMDKIWLDLGTLDPLPMNTIPIPSYTLMYVVRSAYHIWNDRKVSYRLVRVEEDQQEGMVACDGYAKYFDTLDQMSKIKADSKEGRTQALL